MDFWREVIIPVICALAGSGLIGAALAWCLNQLAKKHDDLSKEVKTLRDDKLVGIKRELEKEDKHLERRIDKVEENFDKHKEADVSQKILNSLETLNSTTARTDARVAKIAEDTADQNARINANKDYINNLDQSFQNHKREKHT